jgi:hypothetical protein
MASMLAAMGLGMISLEQAEAEGLVSTPAERQVWAELLGAVSEIHARGGIVEIPIDPL